MQKIELETYIQEHILNNLEQTKLIIQKQTQTFKHLLIGKIEQNYDSINKEKLESLFNDNIYLKIQQLLEIVLNEYENSENEFYIKNLKTADLIFNTLNDKRTQIIYLGNLMKKIKEKNIIVKTIFSETLTDNSIDEIFEQFIHIIIQNPHISMDESNELHALIEHYYSMYKSDVSLVIEQYLHNNKMVAIEKIEEEIDNKNLRNGKSSTIFKLERSITNNSLRAIEQLLLNTIDKYKNNSINELKICSSSVIDIIFKMLPYEYQSQKGLLEIIVDTNINERLGKILDTEIRKIMQILQNKNQDIIENELYEEKRYKKIDDYEFDFDIIDKVYQDVLHEIIIAYDIPENSDYIKRINLIILSEGNSTKNVFKNLILKINSENKKNLNLIITEMYELTKKLYSISDNNKKNKLVKEKGI